MHAQKRRASSSRRSWPASAVDELSGGPIKSTTRPCRLTGTRVGNGGCVGRWWVAAAGSSQRPRGSSGGRRLIQPEVSSMSYESSSALESRGVRRMPRRTLSESKWSKAIRRRSGVEGSSSFVDRVINVQYTVTIYSSLENDQSSAKCDFSCLSSSCPIHRVQGQADNPTQPPKRGF
jgi:hypothetical protein